MMLRLGYGNFDHGGSQVIPGIGAEGTEAFGGGRDARSALPQFTTI